MHGDAQLGQTMFARGYWPDLAGQGRTLAKLVRSGDPPNGYRTQYSSAATVMRSIGAWAWNGGGPGMLLTRRMLRPSHST